MAEILGKETEFCCGKGGSMHVCDFNMGVPSSIAIVGANGPITTSMVLSYKMKGTH
jgi:pyruvate dehydrogenase E1 component alpha subunit